MAFVMTCATHGVGYRHDEGSNYAHRSRLNSKKNQQNRSRSGSNPRHSRHSNNKDKHQQNQKFFLGDSSDAPNYLGYIESGFVQRQNPIYDNTNDNEFNEQDFSNNNDDDLVDLNQLKIITDDNSVAVPVAAFPKSLIQWPVDGSTKNKRIAEVKKQVKLLGDLIKMTVGNNQDEAVPDDKTPTNPPPFSAHVDMSRLSPQSLALTADEGTQPKWEDVNAHLEAGRLKEAKTIIRETEWAICSPSRETLWRELCRHHAADKDFGDFFYWDTVKQMYGTTDLSETTVQLPACVDVNYTFKHSLSPKGVSACERVLSVVAFSNPAITYAPSLYPICSLLLHYMDESDAYNCVNALVSGSQNKFVTQTKVSHEATWRAAIVLCRKHVRGFSTLAKFGVTQSQIDEAFQSWIWWILGSLPLTHLVRVIDCFLLEGAKILLRLSMAIFQNFIKNVARDSNLAASLSTKGPRDAIISYCQKLPLSPQKLLEKAFNIRGFRRSEIAKVMLQTEMYLKSQRSLQNSGSAYNVTEVPALTRSMSLEGLPTAESQADIQMISHTLTIKELLTLWSWLPTRMTMQKPTLVYTTEEHGCSLTTFYQRVEKCAPTLMVIRTLNDHVFGAYCSTEWAQRNIRDEYGNRQTYFGTGESFLFSLRPSIAKYQWVGISQQKENAQLGHVNHSSELFMHGDTNMITIGGGNGNGIMLDQELRFGKTEKCDTFDNPPLTPDGDFEVKVIEVYSLTKDF